jgi:hypothetical protein
MDADTAFALETKLEAVALYDVAFLNTLNTGDVYLDHCGREVMVWSRCGDTAFVHEDGSDWLIEILLDDEVVTVTRRGSFVLIAWAIGYFERRAWRAED